MQVITTTQLRTKSKNLIESLKQGETINLIHRSEIVGEIKPKKQSTKVFDAKQFLGDVKDIKISKLTDEQIEKRYREIMEKKHGKYLP